MERGKYSLKQWCLDNNENWILDNWDYTNNHIDPSEIAYQSNKKIYLHCGNPNHLPIQYAVYALTRPSSKTSESNFCIGCKSVAEYVNEKYGNSFIDSIWSDKNKISPYEVSAGSAKRIYLKCRNDDTHPDFELYAYNVKNSIGCPYCSGKKVCHSNSLIFHFPEIMKIWSNNNAETPDNYTCQSNRTAWFKCENGLHEDYERSICNSVLYKFGCPKCGRNNQRIVSGSDHPFWNPNLSEDRRIRKSNKYQDWRSAVFKRDNYLCQCCGDSSHNRLNAHHIYGFSKYPDLRFDLNNGITMCTDCHDSNVKGSLHNIYGTKNVTPDILEKYINDRRKQIGIDMVFSINDFINGNNMLMR